MGESLTFMGMSMLFIDSAREDFIRAMFVRGVKGRNLPTVNRINLSIW